MSRGGRGGFGGGRGGFSAGGRDIPFEIDPNLKPDFAPSELFPPNPPPVQTALSKEERIYIARFREFRDKVSNGPFFTVMAKKRGLENPFEEIERFSRKYERKRRKVPKLDARPYVFEFFPPELHTTLDPNHTVSTDAKSKVTTKRLHFSSLEAFNDDSTADPLLNEDEEDEGRVKEGEGEDDAGAKGDDEEEEEEEEDEDQFQDDMEGDYNAEQYFDSGEGEGWGDDGGGDDDGWF
ncbi:DNA-directed RNA polymerase III, subunit Rpc31 [Terfezia claveryi]|nr:DNA-directed RNA polymerase III, subunit Rpc31 [Terfezia claveryi]